MIVNSCAKEHRSLKIQCLVSDQEFSSVVTARRRTGIEVEMTSSDVYGPFRHCAYSVASDDASGMFYSIQQGAKVCLFSGERGKFFDHVMRSVKKLRPDVIAPFTESSKIWLILAKFEENAGISLKHKKSVRKRTVGDMPKTALEWDRTAKARAYEGALDVFTKASKNGLVIESMRAFTNENDSLDVAVSRKGLITVYKGDIGAIYDNILRPIIDHGMERKKRFSQRGRSERPDKEPKPLLIKYERDVLGDEDSRERFCQLIDKYTHCNYAIVHAGNPHIYISVLDRTDNSSLAVRSVGDNALAIIPQIRTSAASLLRFTEFLSCEFSEGVISEYGQ